MKRINLAQLLFVLLLCEVAYLLGTQAYSLAATPPESPCATPTPADLKVAVETVKPSATPRITPTPRTVTPTPRPSPKWPKETEIDWGETKCLACFDKSYLPDRATFITKVVANETVQNRVDSGRAEDTISLTLRNHYEYPGYSTRAWITQANMDAAEFAMRSWAETKNGDRSRRYTPPTGVYLCFSKDGQFVKVYDWDWKLVCDTSAFQ